MLEIFEKIITFHSHELVLTNQRVLYWPAQRTLVLSDLHVGKAAHFRRNGIAIPSTSQEVDLSKLTALIHYYSVRKVIVVGDLLHTGKAEEVEIFKNVIKNHTEVQFVLIRGNHDRFAKVMEKKLGLQGIFDTYELDGISFVHDAKDWEGRHAISGHVHPGVTCTLANKQKIRLPSFIVSPQNIVLPAYSTFTGLDTNFRITGAKYYPFYEEGIFEL